MARLGGIIFGIGAVAAVTAAYVVSNDARDEGAETVAAPAVETPIEAVVAVPETPEEAPPAVDNKAVLPEAEIAEAVPQDPQKMPEAPDFDVVRVDEQGSALVAGRAGPDQEVTLRLDGEAVATATTDGDGNFVSFFTVPQSDVPQVLSLEAVDEAGTAIASEGGVIVAPAPPVAPVPEPEVEVAAAPVPADPAPEAPPATSHAAPVAPLAAAAVQETAPVVPQAPEPSQAAALPELADEAPSVGGDVTRPEAPAAVASAALEPPAPARPVTTASAAPRLLRTGPDGLAVLPSGGPGPEAQTSLGIGAISYDAEGEVQVAGQAEGPVDLRIYLDNRPIQDIQADATGAWTSQLPDVEPGVYTLRIDALEEDGAVASRIETPFERAEPDVAAALAGETGAITVQPGFTLWAISETHFGQGTQYVQIFEANRDLIRDPDLIYPGQVFALPEPG